jgi:molybdopterin molybdotransferase
MLSVAEARARILEHFRPLAAETIPLAEASTRALAHDIVAAQPLPPFANSSMDGYAVRVREVAAASREQPVMLTVSGDIPAGAPMPPPLALGTTMRIMTGAPVPEGAEAVIPVEDTDDRRDHSGALPPPVVKFFKGTALGTNIRPVGQDVRAGQTVLRAGTVLRAAQVGVLAGLGYAEIAVHRQPLVAILSTGDELCEIGETPRPGQIRDTNSYTLAASAAHYGGRALRLGIARDRADEVRARLLAAVEAGADLILSSAGVSVGAYDVVKEVVEAEGALDFWRVRMRPGKPLVFGHVRGVPFFGLPGNPVSALVTFEVFVRPVILKMGGRVQLDKPEVKAVLLEPLQSDGRESYLRVTLEKRGEGYAARSTGDQGSAVLTSLVRANGLLIVPEGVREVRAGETLPVWRLGEDV